MSTTISQKIFRPQKTSTSLLGQCQSKVVHVDKNTNVGELGIEEIYPVPVEANL